MHIYLLPVRYTISYSEGMEFMEGVGFADMGDLVLDAGWKSVIHLSVEGSIIPLDTGG